MTKSKKSILELGETLEVEELKKEISIKEKELVEIITDTENLKNELSVLKQKYDSEIGRLYLQLDEIEIAISQFKTIEELVEKWLSREEAEMIIGERTRKEQEKIQKQYSEIQEQEDEIEKRKKINEAEQKELKQLYKKLALKFHPDVCGGDDTLMKKINQAYEQNDLEALRLLDQTDSFWENQSNWLEDLRKNLNNINKLIEAKNKELEQLKNSEWYVFHKNLQKNKNLLGELKEKIISDINTKKKELISLKK